MKKSLVFLLLLSLGLHAQQTISGTFSPAKEYTWLVAYHLTPGSQNYIADTAITNGEFTLQIGIDKPIGIYRLVYAVPQDEFYFDIIYNGKEAIKLNYNSSEGVIFTTSLENIPYSTYFKERNKIDKELIDYYASGKTDLEAYKSIFDRLTELQKSFEKKTEGFISHAFITANRPYIPRKYEPLSDFIPNHKKNYFESFDVSNTTLQASGFLTDKLLNYVFTALPLEEMDSEASQKHMLKNVDTIAEKLGGTNENYRFSIFYAIWSQAAATGLNTVSDYTYTTFLKDLALKTDNAQTILDIEVHNRLRLGAVAPELEWEENNTPQKLSAWDGGEKYLLVFWSSTCHHCLEELPALHKKLSKNNDVKILAVGLEDTTATWTTEAGKLPNFTHTIALGKWESTYADLYNITSTPSYFILDKEKHIIAKPESDREVISFLERKE